VAPSDSRSVNCYGQGHLVCKFPINVTVPSQVQVGYHGTVNKNCTAAAMPTIRVLEPPGFGTLSVKTGTITTTEQWV
jgi:hypothetical protein